MGNVAHLDCHRAPAPTAVAAGGAVGATARQMEALRFIAGFHAALGRSPMLWEIGHGIGCTKHNAHRMLAGLERRGLIRRNAQRENRRKPIEILRSPAIPRASDGAPLFFIPMERLKHHGGHHG